MDVSDAASAIGSVHRRNEATALWTPSIIGLYGISGSGKTFMLNQLMGKLGKTSFEYFEGSDAINSVTPGGLDEFHKLAGNEKTKYRQRAIDGIRGQCAASGKVGIVAGHFMFWSEEAETGVRVYTQTDLDVYTHILYVNTPVEEMAQRRENDKKHHLTWSIQHLSRWQEAEIQELRGLCRNHGILFSTIYPNLVDKLPTLILDFHRHTEDYNLSVAERYLDETVSAQYDKLETVLLMDADKTLTPEDTGALFWRNHRQPESDSNPLDVLFGSQMGHSYTAFRQAMLLYEEMTSDSGFDATCEDVASQTALYPEFITLLRLVGKYNHVCPVIVTCGLRRVWEKIIAREGLSMTVKILGGGRVADGFVITPSVKEVIANRVKVVHQAYTWAIGDSPLDLPMMSVANEAIIVVGDKQTRSRSMDSGLSAAIKDGLHARQALLPRTCPVRLETSNLTVVDLTGDEFINAILQRRNRPGCLQFVHETDSEAAKLLMTPMRNAAISGPDQRKAHSNVGAFLATKHLSEVIGLEEYTIPHVQAHKTTGYRLHGEAKTLIVAVMRAGEAMALDISDVFPKAMFLHASKPDDIKQNHLEQSITVILVDSVINSGETIVRFIRFIRGLHSAVRIVVVAGVVQDQAVFGCSPLRALARSSDLTIVALRVSNNKYTGTGNTDTGNRLFNTFHLA
ncbi:unnamed protein product [Aspergillus oryzae]|nr:unnamed protein product [Aspergillus oryzae]GMF97382.1 unnamed protein product [Aspergillus oryzae]